MLSRRNVLTSTAAAGLGLAAAAPATGNANPACAPEKAALGGRIIVDAQVHVWLADTPARPWPADGVGQAHIPRPFSHYELLARMDEAGVDRTVIVPPSWEGFRNDYATEAVAKWPHRFAIMGRLSVDDPGAKERLATWRDQPGMLGFRHIFNRRTASWLTDGTADWFWPAAAALGLPVMAQTTGRAADWLRVVERNPDLVLIIDHMNLSEETARQGRIAEAVAEAVAFAKHPNVSVKMSSLPHKSSQPYPFRDLSDHIRRVFDAFGPRRCFWGTDITAGLDRFPKLTYQQRITHFTEELPFLSEPDKDWIMGRAIMRRLGWA
ncbi:MAG: amidohydrolase [Alphaproteobacteria bacterium]|nr:amidohydrolase [Alphaproteobacteria bacterium]